MAVLASRHASVIGQHPELTIHDRLRRGHHTSREGSDQSPGEPASCRWMTSSSRIR
jgi:hypothetical protein